MNIRQLDNIISWLLSKYKSSPYRWNEQQVRSFCESVGLQWAESIITVQTAPKQRSSNSQEAQPNSNKFQIPLLDVCTKQFEEILELCNAQSIYKLISHSIDINLYYQIQKLKIWSLIILKYQHYREILKKHYGTRLFSQSKCKSCTAEISCACQILSNLQYEIETYIKGIYELPSIQNQNRRSSMYISSDIINLLLKSISHLPSSDQQPLFWDMDDIKVLLHIIKFQDYYQLLFQNQIDGFVLLVLVNPPFKGDNLFLKCLLMSQSNFSQKSQNLLFQNRQSMARNTMQTASKYHQINQFLHLLHYLLQILSLTAYKNQESYAECKQLRQRKVSQIRWMSLFYFTKDTSLGQANRNSIQTGQFRRSSKSYGNVEQQIKIRNKTETLDQTEIKVMVADQSLEQIKKQFSQPNVTHSATTSPYVNRDNKWIKFKNQNVYCDNTEDTVNRNSSFLIQEKDCIQQELERDRQNTETHIQIEEEILSVGNANQSQEEHSQQLSNQEEELQEFNDQMQQSVVFMQQSVLIQQPQLYSPLQEIYLSFNNFIIRISNNNFINFLNLSKIMILLIHNISFLSLFQIKKIKIWFLNQEYNKLKELQQQQQQQQQQQYMNESVFLGQPNVIQQSTIMQQSTMMQQSVILQQSTIMQQSTLLEKSIQIQQIIEQQDKQRLQLKSSIKEQILTRIEKLTYQPQFDLFQLSQQTHLKLKCEEQKLKVVNVQGASFGRNEDCTFSFTDHSKISSKHCQIYYKDKAFYLIDTGSKGGTFVKINHNFVIEREMSFYIGNRFAFKIINIDTDTGFLEVRYEHEGTAKHKQIQLKKGDRFLIGRERSKNNFAFMHSQCNRLMSAKHLEIYYDYNFKAGSIKLMINDLESKNGTWLRLSEKQVISTPFLLQKGVKFNLSFELMFDVFEMVCDV